MAVFRRDVHHLGLASALPVLKPVAALAGVGALSGAALPSPSRFSAWLSCSRCRLIARDTSWPPVSGVPEGTVQNVGGAMGAQNLGPWRSGDSAALQPIGSADRGCRRPADLLVVGWASLLLEPRLAGPRASPPTLVRRSCATRAAPQSCLRLFHGRDWPSSWFPTGCATRPSVRCWKWTASRCTRPRRSLGTPA
jgi:hypothetical protein